jgi:threonine synthase
MELATFFYPKNSVGIYIHRKRTIEMHYRSTRDVGINPELLSFETTLFRGLAPDGGLYLPEFIPSVSPIDSWKTLSFPRLASKIFRHYIDVSEINDTDLDSILDSSFSTFTHPEITPMKKLDGVYLLELFHGPTFAFKDVALQVVGMFVVGLTV